jgi:hypothetical protein
MTDSKMPLKPDGTPRTVEIQRAIQQKEEKLVKDTIILQKVNKARRESFKERFPGQIEHCMRLVTDRLHSLLAKQPTDYADVSTWSGKPDEILSLSHSLYYLSIINQHYPFEE